MVRFLAMAYLGRARFCSFGLMKSQDFVLRFALAVDVLFAICEPCHKARSLGVGKAGCQLQDAFCIENIGLITFAILCQKFQLVSGTK